jgi:hypothetical protein
MLQSLGNSNFAIKASYRFCLMLSETMHFSSCFLPFQNLYVTRTFSLTSFSTDVFHAFTETGGVTSALQQGQLVLPGSPRGFITEVTIAK